MAILRPSHQETPAAGALLERADYLATLEDRFTLALNDRRGSMVFIAGEAGVGKSALVRRFCEASAQSARALTGMCDPLYTPQPLGPLFDIAPDISERFQALVESGKRPFDVATALMRELASQPGVILLFEDAHWADEATLDVLRFLASRIETLPVLVLVTYRDDLDRAHPMRILLGDLPTGRSIARLRLEPLSQEAVAQLARPHGVDAKELYRKTAGNPFFVTEALAADDVAIPPTIRDAVLARAARLGPTALTLLEAVAIAPPQAELWLLDVLAGADTLDQLDVCLSSGILSSAGAAVRFRHELARLAIEDALSPVRRVALHRQALRALEATSAGGHDLARLVHHAEAAGDRAAIVRYAPAAGAHAASLGAHREAEAYYALALTGSDGLEPLACGELYRLQANEAFLSDHFSTSIASGRQAVETFRRAGDIEREGRALRELASHLRCIGEVQQAGAMGREAVALLKRLAPGRELAMAYANLAYFNMNEDNAAGVASPAERALTLAHELGDVEVELHVLNTLGTMRLLLGDEHGHALLQESLRLALANSKEEHVGRAYLNDAWAALRTRSYTRYWPMFQEARGYCAEHGLTLWLHYVLAYASRASLDQGRFNEAIELANQVLHDPRTVLPRITLLVTLALLRARRGDPDVWPLLDEALALAEPTGELQHTAPVAAARAEVSWLEGRPEAVRAATDAVFETAVRNGAPWVVGEIACWRWRAGIEPPNEGCAEPYALELAGEWQAAARIWDERGCPYEAALARASARDEDALREALTSLRRLGMTATARIVARRLRELGARDLPRGPRASTQANDANLTAREVEVLALMARGLRNADIASALYLSPKTVEHHISAILAKLEARTRVEAITLARARGLVPADTPPLVH